MKNKLKYIGLSVVLLSVMLVGCGNWNQKTVSTETNIQIHTEIKEQAEETVPAKKKMLTETHETALTEVVPKTEEHETVQTEVVPKIEEETDIMTTLEQNEKETKTEKVSTVDKEMTMKLYIDNMNVEIEWEDNESVNALKKLADGGLTIEMSKYGGFEQVGSIGSSLPRNDVDITTQSGDIMLYSGNQIVVFYGSNTWSYTRLGRIVNKTDRELADLLGNENVILKIITE